jgi:uncharacterized protein (UPF0261 family)
MSNGKVAIIATLDTKGPEVAYLRDQLVRLGVATLVVDTGILGEPVGIVPDVSRAQLAERGGMTLEGLQTVGSRGKAVTLMRTFVTEFIRERYAAGEIIGGISVGGVGAVMGAAAIQTLPVGVPKIVIAPTASGHHEFGPYVGTKDVMVIHSIVDILGVNDVAKTVFDNAAAAMKGMLDHGHSLPARAAGTMTVAATMLGNTTKAVEQLKAVLEESGVETVVFHSSGVGGPSMEELARTGQFVGVVDYTTNEIGDRRIGGIHDATPERLTVVGELGLPQVVIPGCLDFAVFDAKTLPSELRSRKIYDHNPEYALVGYTHDEKRDIAIEFAEKLNQSTGLVHVIFPLGGLSIPAREGGVFFDPEGDEIMRSTIQSTLRPDITFETSDAHINDLELGTLAAQRLLELLNKQKGNERND